MALLSLLLTLVVVWSTVYLITKFWERIPRWKYLSKRRDVHILPSSRRHKQALIVNETRHSLGSTSSLKVTVNLGWLWAEVQSVDDDLVKTLHLKSRTKQDHRQTEWGDTLITFLEVYYDIGAIVGLVCFLLVPLCLAYTLYTMTSMTITPPTFDVSPKQQVSVSSVAASGPQAGSDFRNAGPVFLIPGITTPFRDIPIMLVAGFLAISWHELGHALSAALDGVPILAVGFVLIVIFPGAYVSLPQTTLDLLPLKARLRILLAGIWHNLILRCFIGILAHLGKGGLSIPIFMLLGYSDYNEKGVIIQLVHQTSPLFGVLYPGTLVTHLDDLELHDSLTYRHWDTYLLSSQYESGVEDRYANLGWCVDEKEFAALSEDCCTQSHKATSPANVSRSICFVDTRMILKRCLDPSTVLRSSRCLEACSESTSICISPIQQENLLRLTSFDEQGIEQVIFYQGSKKRLWEEVKVGHLLAPWWLPQSFLLDVRLFWEYTQAISLSLAVFNLLPLPHLDGGELLHTLLSLSHAPSPSLSPSASTPPNLAGSPARLLGGIVNSIAGSRLRRYLIAKQRVVERSVHAVIAILLVAVVGAVVSNSR